MPTEERLLTVEEAAKLLHTSKDFLYRHWRQLPFARKLSRKQLRFSPTGIDEYIRQANTGGSTLVSTLREDTSHARESVEARQDILDSLRP